MKSLVRDDDTFVTLIQAAQGDPSLKRQLIAVLSLDKSQRDVALRLFLDEMRQKGTSKEILDTASNLLSEDVANVVLDLLRQDSSEDLIVTKGPTACVLSDAKLFIALILGLTIPPMIVAVILSFMQYRPLSPRLVLSYPVFISAILGMALGAAVLSKRSWKVILWLCIIDVAIAVLIKML